MPCWGRGARHNDNHWLYAYTYYLRPHLNVGGCPYFLKGFHFLGVPRPSLQCGSSGKEAGILSSSGNWASSSEWWPQGCSSGSEKQLFSLIPEVAPELV